MVENWYRYDVIRYAAPLDEWDRPQGIGRVTVQLSTFKVLKVTPKGVWLIETIGIWDCEPKRFVLRDARKRFACPTKKEAAESFSARKKRQLRILRAQAKDVERALKVFDFKEDDPKKQYG